MQQTSGLPPSTGDGARHRFQLALEGVSAGVRISLAGAGPTISVVLFLSRPQVVQGGNAWDRLRLTRPGSRLAVVPAVSRQSDPRRRPHGRAELHRALGAGRL